MPLVMVKEDRRRSFGIGGAGNIRTREEAIVPDPIPGDDNLKRRRSSLMSLGSTSGESGESKSSKLSGRLRRMFSSRTESIPEGTK
ncbi:uncharacterized protein GGS25DRAFT_92236 [Hypoxylon fragiforme]|uniref:uncharacterized protein n=1 Tax=Hypoxylon fragiforme TaxID=63214 RepID=UPI0020C6DF74|nr:uncharacterized protein GGS25DRAFT_92236 [Hypoxylon fragiforme]KAI2603421.1 hypothetical protein GGS25DRAFT_92236 [Hypoxylon fragiforme]